MPEQPVTPGKQPKAGSTPPTTTRSTTGATTPSSTGDSFDQSLNASRTGGADLDAKVAQMRASLLSGEDISMGSVSGLTVLDDLPGYGLGGNRTHRTVADLLNDLTKFDQPEVEALQHQLYSAGYFPDAYYQDKGNNPVQWGNRFDQATRRAYGLLLADGLSFKDLSIDQILSDRSEDFSRTGRTANGSQVSRNGIVGGGKLYETVLDDPASIRKAAEDLGQQLLGRKPTGAKLQEYVDLIQGQQKKEQAAQHSAEEANTKQNFNADVAQANANTAGQAAGAGGFDSFVSSVIGAESGGSLTAVSPLTAHGYATGKYQVLDSTWGNFQGYARAKDAPESVQDQFAIGRLRTLHDKYGAAGAAVAWYAGEAQAKDFVKNPNDPKWQKPQYATVNGKKVEMPSIASYANKVTKGSGVAGGNQNAADVYVDPTYTETTKVDATARLAEQIRNDNPDEAQAHDIAGYYDTFRSIIGADRGGA